MRLREDGSDDPVEGVAHTTIESERERTLAAERARFAHDLYDALIQSLIGIEVEAEVMRRHAAADDSAGEARLARLQQLLRAEIHSARALMRRLKSPTLDPGHRRAQDRFQAGAREAARSVGSNGGPTTAGAPIRVVIADDHPIFRTGLVNLIGTEPGFQVVGEASDGDEALCLVDTLHPDVLLLALALPRVAGMEVLAELNQHAADVRTIVLTTEIEGREILKALQLGAWGVMLKQAATECLFTGVRAVVAGQHWVERQAVSDLVEALRQQYGRPYPAVASAGLTARETEVLALVGAGSTNRAIAERFSISEHTVKHHLTNIFDKVGVSNRLELALFAVRHGVSAVHIARSRNRLRIPSGGASPDRAVAHDKPAWPARSSGMRARRQPS